jgi:hypothetical protein
MDNNDKIIDALRHYLGRSVTYQGSVYEIIEVLDEPLALVLQDAEQHTTIQADQHGEAHRRVPQTRTVPIPIDEKDHYDLSEVGIELLTNEATG